MASSFFTCCRGRFERVHADSHSHDIITGSAHDIASSIWVVAAVMLFVYSLDGLRSHYVGCVATIWDVSASIWVFKASFQTAKTSNPNPSDEDKEKDLRRIPKTKNSSRELRQGTKTVN